MSQELHQLALDLAKEGGRARWWYGATSGVRGAFGRGADDIRDTARGMAAAKGWSQESQENIYARTGRRGKDPEAWVFGTGAVAWQETGTSRHGPNPVLGPALDRHEDGIIEDVADAAADIL